MIYFCCLMKNRQGLVLLMTVAILGVTGFQLYWLKQSYDREKKSLTIKTNAAFHETVMKLQGSKIKLDSTTWKGADGKPVSLILRGDKEQLPAKPGEGVISTINVIRSRLSDSLKKRGGGRVIISMKESSVDIRKDSAQHDGSLPSPHQKDYFINLLYGIDSLSEKLKVTEIDSAFAKKLESEKVRVPFTVIETDSCSREMDTQANQVVIGFAKPVLYELKLGNTFPWLVRQILQPILFSILLLGITILSFVLLYRSLRRQQKLAELKNEFISNITHELKTPIATVGVAIEALKNFNAMDNPERTREYLDISGNELQRLSLLVDKVLKLSMFEKKEIDLKYENLDLYDLAQEVITSLKLQFEKHHASVQLSRQGDTSLRADKLHLLSVIFNLVDNALKYSKENPVVNIGISGDDEQVMMTVEDNGIGIPPEYREKVFEKFFRIPHGDTHNAKGYGLGLSYVAQVVKKHLGTIRIEDGKETGTKLIITIPKNGSI